MSDKTRLVGLKKGESKNEDLYKELFVTDSGYRLISSSPKVFSAIHPEDFGEDFYISEDELSSYVDGFTQAILDNIDSVINSVVQDTNNNTEDNISSDPDLKLSLYRSFKSFYDKWVSNSYDSVNKSSGYFFNNYGKEDNRMLYEHFKFINRANQDVGKKAVIDFSYLSNLASTKNGQGPTQSLYESLTSLLSKNNFDFWPLPANINLSTVSLTNEQVEDIFRPLTFVDKIHPGPSFVCVHIGGSSRSLADLKDNSNICNLNGTNFEYVDDSFDITNTEDLPAEYTKEGEGLVVFRVRYGQEAQNHFNSIELDQTEFKETQESLQIIDALTNPNSGSNPSQIGKGNNMYDVYLTRAYNCTVSGLGNMSIQPLMYFKLENVPMFRGTYLINAVSHTITNNKITTEFTGMRQPKVTVPIVTEALSLIDLALVEIVQTDTNQQSTTSTSTTQSTTKIENVSGGPGLEPIINLTVGKESGGDYEIYNFGKSGGSGIRSITQGSKYYKQDAIKLTDKTVSYILNTVQRSSTTKYCTTPGTGEAFAVGKFQTIPCTLQSVMNKLNMANDLFDAAGQERIGNYLFVGGGRKSLAAYLKGTNDGVEEDLRKAVQDLGQEFASMPIIIKDGVTWGNVVTGEGNKAYYGGKGPNPDTVSTSVGTVVKALIKSRIQYSNKKPKFIPSYYTA